MWHLQPRVQGSTVDPAKRAELAFTAPLPTTLELRRELADVWLKAGAIGASMEELEAAQLWEPLVTCYLMAGAFWVCGTCARLA